MRFCRTKKIPEHIDKNEYVIQAPTFFDEIKLCATKKPKNKVMTINYLRELVAAIGGKYMGEDFDALRDINVSYYKGIPCEDEAHINETLIRLFNEKLPSMLDAYVEYYIKRRPDGTKLIYFGGSGDQNGAFIRNGFEQILEKDLEKEQKAVKKQSAKDDK